MNLLEDPWLPAIGRDGVRRLIRPGEVTAEEGQRFQAIVAPRPDMTGSLVQFLIGLYQTILLPEHEDAWRSVYEAPPSPADMEKRLAPFQEVFELDHPEHPWMQEGGLERKTEVGVEALLIDTPGGQTLRKNTDHFVKRRSGFGLSPVVAAWSLWTLQLNAPQGGRGHRTSLRGGGPLTTLIQGDTLWETVWRNVLPANVLPESDDGNQAAIQVPDEGVFPWMGPVRVSEGDVPTTPEHVSWLQVFWSMPRRILLDVEGAEPGTCSLTGEETEQLIERYWTRPYGPKYEGAWNHPLTPHRPDPGGPHITLKGGSGVTGYRNWIGLVLKNPEGAMPATNVHHFLHVRGRRLRERNASLWVFGYDMDSMKARAWQEGKMPVPVVEPERLDTFAAEARRMVAGAERAASATRWASKQALFPPDEEVRGNLNWISDQVWEATEPAFYGALSELARADMTSGWLAEHRTEWHRVIARAALTVFDDVAASGDVVREDPKRLARARAKLRGSVYGKKIREIMALSEEVADATA